jgi:hypothetical protein
MSSLQRTKLNQVDEHLQGPLVTQVAAIRHRACPLERLDLRAQEWSPKFVTAMWDYSLRIWQVSNDAFHADTNEQVKCYKLEELERGETRLRSRLTELKPLLHLFQQKHFDSPYTVNGLRYDSQNCWIALTVLFLDEAESINPSPDNDLIPRYLTT